MTPRFKKGDRVEWTYRHFTNSTTSFLRTKTGTVIDFSGDVKNERYVSGSIIHVHFDGNKHPCKKHYSELKLAQMGE